MATAMDVSAKSPEDWLVFRAKSTLKSDPYASKAWLITARSLFPRNFTIQYEAYCVEKSHKNTKEAAKHIEEMLMNFPQEKQLWSEVHTLCEALQSEATDEQTKFLKDLFASLPNNLQCHMLLQIVENTTDVLEQCRLTLLILSRYPERIPDQGIKLVESLLTAEKHARIQTPVNCYRKYMACDVLPLVLKTKKNELTQKPLVRWLQKGIEFYISYVTQPAEQTSLNQGQQSPAAELLSPKSKLSFGIGGRRVSISGLAEKDAFISNPWDKLFDLIHLVAEHLGWNLGSLFTSTSIDSQWQQLHSLYQHLNHKAGTDMSSAHKQLLYSSTVMLFHSLHKYYLRMDPDKFTGNAGSSHHPLVLIEGFKTGSTTAYEHKSKKHKADTVTPTIHASKTIHKPQDIIQSFTTALKCWQLLQSSEVLEKEFSKLCQYWKADNWDWLKAFEIDVLIYQGKFQEAINKLTSFQPKTKLPMTQVQMNLQLASCYFALSNHVKASEMVMQVVEALPSGSTPTPDLVTPVTSGRPLQLLTCTESEVMPYLIHLLIQSFKDKGLRGNYDMCVGHMLVLLQYDWPRYASLLGEVTDYIRNKGSFTYSLFFNYVICMDILEEFAYLKTQDGGKYVLDILSTSTEVIARQRTVTRGVNKGVKEDFKVSMEKQVARSNESPEAVIRQLLLEEKDNIKVHLK